MYDKRTGTKRLFKPVYGYKISAPGGAGGNTRRMWTSPSLPQGYIEVEITDEGSGGGGTSEALKTDTQ